MTLVKLLVQAGKLREADVPASRPTMPPTPPGRSTNCSSNAASPRKRTSCARRGSSAYVVDLTNVTVEPTALKAMPLNWSTAAT